MHGMPPTLFGARDRRKYTRVATMAQKLLARAAVNRKVDRCSRLSVSDTAPDGLNGKKFRELLCVVS